jgi:starch synthase (maltosyl-transferring)
MLRIRPAIVHTFLFHANLLGRVAARISSVPRVLSSIRVAEQRNSYHSIVENLSCRMSDRVTCVSRGVADFVRRRAHVPASRLVVVPNGIAADSMALASPSDRAALGVARNSVLAVFVGRLDAQKGLELLLEAMRQVYSRLPQLELLLVGAGPQRGELEQISRRLGIESRTRFLGFRTDVPAILSCADLFILPSRWEGMPNAVLEAMAAGLPVIATKTEGTRELVRHGETGWLVPIGNASELAQAMLELTSDQERRTRWGRQGREVVRRDFSLAAMIRHYVQLYDCLLDSGRSIP